MDFRDNPEEATFRTEVREFIGREYAGDRAKARRAARRRLPHRAARRRWPATRPG